MIVKLEVNIPQRITLKRADGKEVEGRFGPQFLHSLLPEGQIYLDPPAEQKLAECGVRDGDTVEICKKPRGEWRVEKVVEAGTNSQDAPTSLSNGQVQARPVMNNHQDTSAPVKTPMDRAMTMYLIMAGRATREAEQVLGAEGGSVRFDSRDVASLATTLLIQSFKEGWLSYLTPETAQRYVGDAKLANLRTQAAAVAKPAATATAPAREFPAAEKAWTTRGEMKAIFAQLREAVGEVEYQRELEVAGVSDPVELRYLNDARACYTRLVQIARREREAA